MFALYRNPQRGRLAAAILFGLAMPGIGFAGEAAAPTGNDEGKALDLALALDAQRVAAAPQEGLPPGSDKPAATTLDKVEVTGSRIKRTDVETALPVTIIQKQQIDAQGITSAEQLMMYLNVAGNGSDNLASNAGIAPAQLRGNNGVSGANLRGQGADATLVLLNGRRVATDGLRGNAVDLNSIPFAAIERVEVLRDGASAVYGTDAIGGVINFITRTNYQGVTLDADSDVTQEGGGNIYTYSILGGIGDLDRDRWNAWASLNYKKNQILRGTDRDFSNAFQPDRGLVPDTRGTPFATITNLKGGLIPTTGLPDPAGGANQTLVNTLGLPGAAGCASGGDSMGAYGYQIWNVPGSKYACAWDYPANEVMQQPVESVQFLGRATFKINDSTQVYAEMMGSRVKSNRQFEAQQISSSATESASTLGPSTWYPLNDVTKATYDSIYNALADYFGSGNLTYGNPIPYRWRCEVCGPREIRTTNKAYRILLGLDGSVGGWDYTAGLSRASSEAESTLGSGYYYTQAFKAALGSGYLNPFLSPGEQQSEQGIEMLRAASAAGVRLYGGTSTTTTFDVSFSGGLGFDLPGGEAQAAVGSEWRREEFEFDSTKDGITLDNSYIFGAPFDAVNDLPKASRDVKAVYAEIDLPVLSSLEFDIAGRHDEYDGFGGTTNPKYSFKWQPFDALAFRGSYSTGFRVPEFNQLYYGVTESPYTGLDLADPGKCPGGVANTTDPNCAAINPNILTGGNSKLKPERSKQGSVGVVVAPSSKFDFSVDWWSITRTDTINSATLATLIAHYDDLQGNWIRDSDGNVVDIDERYVNSGGSRTKGVDASANLRGDLYGGTWKLNLDGTYLLDYRQKDYAWLPYTDNLVGEYVRYYSLPLRWKHTLSFGWDKGDWSQTLTQIYRSGYKDEVPVSVQNGSFIPSDWDPDVKRYIVYNYYVAWKGIPHALVSFGVENLLDTDPPFTAHMNDYASGAGWEPRVADPRGRSFNLKLEYKFE